MTAAGCRFFAPSLSYSQIDLPFSNRSRTHGHKEFACCGHGQVCVCLSLSPCVHSDTQEVGKEIERQQKTKQQARSAKSSKQQLACPMTSHKLTILPAYITTRVPFGTSSSNKPKESVLLFFLYSLAYEENKIGTVLRPFQKHLPLNDRIEAWVASLFSPFLSHCNKDSLSPSPSLIHWFLVDPLDRNFGHCSHFHSLSSLQFSCP